MALSWTDRARHLADMADVAFRQGDHALSLALSIRAAKYLYLARNLDRVRVAPKEKEVAS